jgi:HEAT repeat protein
MAGEKLPTEPLLAIIKSEPRLSLRLIAIICLPSSTDADGAFKAAMAALEDQTAEVRAAGVWMIGGLPRPEAVSALKKVLEKNESHQTSHAAIFALGKIKTGKSADALAKYLESALKDDNKAGDIYPALSAFESVTGRRTIPPGANRPEVYKELATDAIKWWITQEGLLPDEKLGPR